MKVGWLSGNRGGGYVKLSLAPMNVITQTAFDANVLKVSCFGYDQRPNRFSFGNCNHPCNARGGCGYQNNSTDNERFDTTITIPYNVNGQYVLQLQAFVGVSQNPIYSCSALNVIGGDETLSCPAPAIIPTATGCENVNTLQAADLTVGTTPGAFCYSRDGVAAIDDSIADVPMNTECDPRVSCSFANLANLCQADITDVILTPTVSPHVSVCSLTASIAQPSPTRAPVAQTTTVAITTTTTDAPVPTTTTTTVDAPVVITTTEAPVVPTTTTEAPVVQTTTAVIPTTTTDAPVVQTTTDAPVVQTTTTTDAPVVETTTSVVESTTETTTTETTTTETTTTETTTTQTTTTETTTTEAISTTVVPVQTTTTLDPVIVTATVVTVPGMPVETSAPTTTCANTVYPTISADQLCDVNSSPVTCSGQQIAQCAYTVTPAGVVGKYVFTTCPQTTACKIFAGVATCDYVTDICLNPSSTISTEAPAPTSSCVTVSPIIANGTSCDSEATQLTCSGTQLAVCALVATSAGFSGFYEFANCPSGTVCDQSCGTAVCNYPSAVICPSAPVDGTVTALATATTTDAPIQTTTVDITTTTTEDQITTTEGPVQTVDVQTTTEDSVQTTIDSTTTTEDAAQMTTTIAVAADATTTIEVLQTTDTPVVIVDATTTTEVVQTTDAPVVIVDATTTTEVVQTTDAPVVIVNETTTTIEVQATANPMTIEATTDSAATTPDSSATPLGYSMTSDLPVPTNF